MGRTVFSELARLCEKLEGTASKLELSGLLSDFLRSLSPEETAPAVYLILGMVFSPSDPRTLDLSWKTLQKVEGDLKGKPSIQKPLAILDVHHYFSEIASTSGPGSRARKERLLKDLLAQSTSLEIKYIKKNIFHEMRHGVGEGVMMKAISQAADVSLSLVRRACMFSGDLGEVTRIALTEGKSGLKGINIQLFKPIQPMLAELAGEFDEVFAEHGGKSALEYKFDGARVQIHKKGDEVRIFSRRLSEVTKSLPEIVELIREKVKTEEALVEGEVVALGENEKPLPFQELMRRFRRVHDIKRMVKEVPVKLYLFDLVYLDGKSLIDTPYKERWNLLSKVCPENLLAERLITGEVSEAKKFLNRAVESGHEGLMAKALDSEYTPGARGKKWFKIKPAEYLDLVIVAADWGYGRREGWLSNYHLAARDEDSGEFMVVGKTFKGLTDKEFTWMTERLQSLKVSETDYTVRVRPELVVEIAYNEIQRSPHYKSGFALRFARITRIREDKGTKDADTIKRIKDLYQQQFKFKGKA